MVTTSTPETTSPEQSIAGWLTSTEFAILEAICDTLLPSLEPPAGSSHSLAAYYRRCAKDLHVAQQIAEKLGQQSVQTQAEIRLFLRLFTAPPASFLFTRSLRPFTRLSQTQREHYLMALSNSPLGLFRQGYQGLKRLAGFIYFSTLDTQGNNPNWEVLDYTPPKAPPQPQTSTITPLVITDNTPLEADVIVVGSGAGGSVVAGELAKAGKQVIILEKGDYNHESNFTSREAQAMPELFAKKGALATNDLGIIMMAGNTLGGGTVVNWMTAFRTPNEILEEWDHCTGVHGCFTGVSLQQSFAEVEQRLRVNTQHSQHNRQNQILSDGATALGYHVGTVPRNAVGCHQRCGACNLGCRYGCNQSTMKTYLQDAYDHGARIIVRGQAERVLIERGQVVGVQASIYDRATNSVQQVNIRAKTVVLAAGALYSPALLVRSGLQNPHIGRHLHVHPTAISVGVYPEKVYAWQGVLQSAYSDQFAYLDGNYGYRLEVAPTHPGLFGMATPWYSARNYRDEMKASAHLSSIMVLTRDKGEGTVRVDATGEPLIEYAISKYDRKHLLHGLHHGTRMHLAAGATRVISLQNKRTDVHRSDQSDVMQQRLHLFDQRIVQHGLGPNRIILFSAHQMGTCRIGGNPRHSVIDPQHQVHAVKGLFVCDSSVFPTACGVNPMLSIMALAHKACQYMK
ncbi:MAG: GMC family oxidoreductase [Blastochloris sp.]|nr:GMC family oxidoreductase [Blastochloris sp.]